MPGLYRSPISLPETTAGKVSIQHRFLRDEAWIIDLREAFMSGRRPLKTKLDEPLRVHALVDEDHGTWMTDEPRELNQIAEMLWNVEPSGSICVGGLGLGVLATACTARGDVTVVERSPDVIALACVPGYGVEQADIREYVETCPRFDFFLLDTWQGTNEATWWREVMPLKRRLHQRFGRSARVHCWAEHIMAGQVRDSAIRQAGDSWYYEHLPAPLSPRDAECFVADVGLPSWEKKFGRGVDLALDAMGAARYNAIAR